MHCGAKYVGGVIMGGAVRPGGYGDIKVDEIKVNV